MTTDALDLPALAGTEKQLTWAAGIRLEKLAQALRAIDEQVAMAQRDGLSAPQIAEAVAGARAIVQGVLSARTRAGWWIDRRSHGPLSVFELS